ncbi:tetratricopeptide repeat protein [Catenulispora yoronensis]
MFDTAADATAWMGTELTNLIAAVESAHTSGFHALATPIAEAMTQYLRLEARKADIVRTQVLAVASAQAVGAPSRESAALTALGLAETDIGRFDDAEAHLTAAVEICRRDGDQAGQANAMACLAVTLAATARPEAGVAVAEEALAISRVLGDVNLETRILNNLAICLHCLGRPKEALECMLEGLPTFRAMGNSHFYLSVAVRNLGFTYLVLDSFAEAEAAFMEAAALFSDIGDSYRHVECLHGLARSQFGQGNVEQARTTVDRADALLDGFDEAWAARYRRELERSPLRYSETLDVDPTALG